MSASEEHNVSIRLPASKSISNRLLIMQSLSGDKIRIENLSDANDTTVLQRMLSTKDHVKNAEDAGTAMRFATARFAVGNEAVSLIGSERMYMRPIAPLVDALQTLGAQIEYRGEYGFPPLHIKPFQGNGVCEVSVDASVSSQFISALMMVGPYLPEGLTIRLKGKSISRPYILMTSGLMEQSGANVSVHFDKIEIKSTPYREAIIAVEPDWSAASYFYAWLALQEKGSVLLNGLTARSLQGDAVVQVLFEHLGVNTTYTAEGALLEKDADFTPPSHWEVDCLHCPDLAQTIAVCAAALGVDTTITGIRSLRIKETDRVQALQTELAKFNVNVQEGDDHIRITGSGIPASNILRSIDTYGDHRMAMAFAPLSCRVHLNIRNKQVVKKSFPAFWEEFGKLTAF